MIRTVRHHADSTLATALRVSTTVILVLAGVSLVLPDAAAEVAEAVMVGLLIATPLARVGWLALRWAREGDRRFASLAAGLLALTGLAAVIAAVTG